MTMRLARPEECGCCARTDLFLEAWVLDKIPESALYRLGVAGALA